MLPPGYCHGSEGRVVTTDRENQVGSITYVIGLLLGFVLAALLAPFTFLYAMLWHEPDDRDVAEALAAFYVGKP